MKPIEEGCLAILINCPKQAGKVVTVGKYLGEPAIMVAGNQHWEVDCSISYGGGLRPTRFTNSADEFYLMRIDGEEFEKEIETERELETLNCD